MKNKYFSELYPKNATTAEQGLMQDLSDELISIFGIECSYILRDDDDEIDYVFGENVLSKFEFSYGITLFPTNVNNYEGVPDFNSKFGLEQRSSANFIMSRTDFSSAIPGNKRYRPQEGDLIWSPIHQKLFEIKYVDDDPDFHQLGIKQQRYFDLYVEIIKYSQNNIDTGIAEIDDVQLDAKYSIELYLDNGTGNYISGEEVYIGDSILDTDFSGKVISFDNTNKIIKIQELNKNPILGRILIGASGNAQYEIVSFDKREDKTFYSTSDNDDIQFEANSILVTTETNPLG